MKEGMLVEYWCLASERTQRVTFLIDCDILKQVLELISHEPSLNRSQILGKVYIFIGLPGDLFLWKNDESGCNTLFFCVYNIN